jgi:hypothetical protein
MARRTEAKQSTPKSIYSPTDLKAGRKTVKTVHPSFEIELRLKPVVSS